MHACVRARKSGRTRRAGRSRARDEKAHNELSIGEQRPTHRSPTDGVLPAPAAVRGTIGSTLTPIMIILSSPASINICGVSSRAMPPAVRASSAPPMMSYIRFVASSRRTALGPGSHGSSTVAGVVAVSSVS